jgi:chitinase
MSKPLATLALVAFVSGCGGSSSATGADAGTATGQWVMGYYVGYDINAYPIAQIDWTGLTHIIFSPMTVQGDGSLNTSFDDENGTGQQDAIALSAAAHAHGVRALLMLGGANNGANIAAAAVPSHRAAFVTALLAEMDAAGYDGIDLDWEDSVNLDDLVSLAQALRAARPDMLLTYPGGMINPNIEIVDSRMTTLALSLDRFNVQSYYPDTAFAGTNSGWDSWFVSPLSGSSGTTPIAIDDTLARYHAAGIPNARLGMGMSFYAICYTGGITGPRQPTSDSTQIVGGDNNYPLSRFYAAGGTFDTSTAAERHRDAIASEPYLSLASTVTDQGCQAATRYISYDDETSIIAKGNFSKSNGYGGIIVWTLEEGFLPAGASGGRAQNALMQALKTGFLDP